MKRLKQHDNPLAVYPLILERLKTVPGVKAVKEVGELAELLPPPPPAARPPRSTARCMWPTVAAGRKAARATGAR